MLRPALALLALAMSSGAFRAEQYKILVTDARISAKKQLAAGPQPWDIGAGGVEKPDPYVVIELDGAAVFSSGKEQDTLAPRWFTGTGYWQVPKTTKVKITVRDADAGKLFSRVGIAGVAVHPDIPAYGKRFINDVLKDVDTDDTIAVWTGTLGQLIATTGGAGNPGDIVAAPGARDRISANIGLEALTVRVIERANDFDITKPTAKSYIGLTGATFEAKKRHSKAVWDVGLGAVQNPDPRYVVYVNGDPIVSGAANKDTFVALWEGELTALQLEPDDTIAIAVLDADAGTMVAGAGKHGLIFSTALSKSAKEQLYEELSKASTDDLAFLWVGSWATLKAKGASFDLPATGFDANVWVNDGLKVASVTTTAKNKEPPPLAAVDVVVQKAVIKATKANGAAWDAGLGNVTRPDPFVKCFVANASGGWDLLATSKVVKDSYTATWDLRLRDARLTPGRKLKLEVYDEDLASHDLIGTIVLTLPNAPDAPKLAGDQIESLELKIERP